MESSMCAWLQWCVDGNLAPKWWLYAETATLHRGLYYWALHAVGMLHMSSDVNPSIFLAFLCTKFVLFSDTRSKLGYLVPRMNKLFFILTNHQIRHHVKWAASQEIADSHLIFLWSLWGYVWVDIFTLSLLRVPPYKYKSTKNLSHCLVYFSFLKCVPNALSWFWSPSMNCVGFAN